MKIRTETNLGSVLVLGGGFWAAFHIRQYLLNLAPLLMPTGPLELTALGLLVWLHAKWRRSVSG
jgi:hypothetical protein